MSVKGKVGRIQLKQNKEKGRPLGGLLYPRLRSLPGEEIRLS